MGIEQQRQIPKRSKLIVLRPGPTDPIIKRSNMKRYSILTTLFLAFLLAGCGSGPSNEAKNAEKKEEADRAKGSSSSNEDKDASDQPKNPWSKEQLMPPAHLADMLKDSSEQPPLIHCLGPTPMIPQSEHFGEAHKDSALKAFKNELEGLPKDTSLVVYCGCCPFDDCPNIRPAFSLLEEMGFKKHKLLGLYTSLKADWIDKGYPVLEGDSL